MARVSANALPQHHREDVARRRAECHPDADLVRSLRDEVRHHTVDPDRRQRECRRGEERQQLHRESPLRHRGRNHRLHGPHAKQRLVGIDGSDFTAHQLGQDRRVTVRANDERQAEIRHLKDRSVEHRRRAGVETIRLHVTDHANDRPPVRAGRLLRSRSGPYARPQRDALADASALGKNWRAKRSLTSTAAGARTSS